MEKKTAHPHKKIDGLHASLREIAIAKGPGAQLPTIRELCQQLKTTRVTLDEVLDQLEAEQIVYRKHRQGIFVSPHIHQKSICILYNAHSLIGKTISPFWSMLFVFLEDEAQRRADHKNENYTFHLIRMDHMHGAQLPEEAVHILRARRIDGIVSIGLNTRSVPEIVPGVPCVTFAAGGYWLVQLNGEDIGYQATRALIGQGCRNMELWMMNETDPDYEALTEVVGMRRALEDQGMQFSPAMLHRYRLRPLQQKLTHQEQGYALARASLNRIQEGYLDGVFIGDDLITDGALIGFEEAGLQVGRDIKIVTHANVGSPILFGRTKNMQVLEYDPYDIVQALFGQLEQLMNSDVADPEPVIWINSHLRV